MFRALIPPIFRNTRLCVTACGIKHPRCCRPVALQILLYHIAAIVLYSLLLLFLYEWIPFACLALVCRPAGNIVGTTSCNTQSIAPEDGRDQRPKHVELTGTINKPLLLHLVGCLCYWISDARLYKHQIYKPQTCEGIHSYQNTKRRLYRTITAVWYDEICRER